MTGSNTSPSTPTGAIWVGYFDEGVFGNNGWDQPIGILLMIKDALIMRDWVRW